MYDLRRGLAIGVLCVLIVLSTVTVLPTAKAQGTAVCGLITSDTTWTLANSPYWVECDVTVDDGVTLGVLSGVNVKFNGYYSIYVEGTFSVALESVDPPAVFTSNESTPQAGDWRAIQFNSTSNDDNSGIANSVIEYSDYGIRLHEASPSSFWWDKIWYNNYGIYSYYSTPRILNSTIIWNDEDGIWADHLDPLDRDPPYTPWPQNKPVPIYVEGSNVSENGEKGIRMKDSSLNVSSSKVSNNNHSGIYVLRTNTTVYDDDVSSNGQHGAYINSSSNATIRNSLFHYNGWDGVSMDYSNESTIVENNFSSNNWNAIYLGGSSRNLIDTNEFWIYWSNCTGPPPWSSSPQVCGPGVVIDDASNDNTVSNNTIADNLGSGNHGVYVIDSYHNEIFSNDFFRNEMGVMVDASHYTNVTKNDFKEDMCSVIVAKNSQWTTIAENDFLDDYSCSIHLNHSSWTIISYNNMTRTSGRSGRGIEMYDTSNSVYIRHNVISKKQEGIHASAGWVGYHIYRNNISDNYYGIYVRGVPGSNYRVAMVIHENSMWENYQGIRVWKAKYLEIRNNSINASQNAAIYVEDDSHVNITNNWIENNTGKGIWLDENSYAIINESNNVANNDYGVYLENGANATINYNNIFGNALWGVYNDVSTSVPDATWNWWGDSNGPVDSDRKGCCDWNLQTSGDDVRDTETYMTDYCGSGSDWLTAKT